MDERMENSDREVLWTYEALMEKTIESLKVERIA